MLENTDINVREIKNYGPIYIFIYLFFLSAIFYIINVLLSQFENRLVFFYIVFFSFSLLFAGTFILTKLLLKKIRSFSVIKGLISSFWIIIFSPLFVNLFPNVEFLVFIIIFILFSITYICFLKYKISKPSLLKLEYWKLIIISTSIIFLGIMIFIQGAFLFQDKLLNYGTLDIYTSVILVMVLLIENVIFFLFSVYIIKNNYFYSILKSIKPFRSLHFVGMVLIGFFVYSSISDSAIFNYENILIIIPSICMLLTWQFSTMLNDYYDVNIDKVVHPDRPLVKERIEPWIFKEITIIFGTLSLIFSFLFSIELLFLNVLFVIAGVLYSIPSIRLKNKVYGHVCVGYGSSVSFLYGFYGVYTLKNIDYIIMSSDISTIFFPDIFLLTLIIFFVFSISPLINAVKDYHGDKEAGVTNIYTVYGFDKGKKIVSILIIILFLTPLILFHSVIDLFMIIPLGLIASYIFYTLERYKIVFILYFIVLTYILLNFGI